MDKNELIKRFASDNDDRILLAQVLDKLDVMENKNIATFTKFLNEHQRSLAERFLEGCGRPKHAFIPTFDGAARMVLAFLPDYMETETVMEGDDIPIASIRASYSPVNQLSHRDFLGGLMGCGIKRETIGDIFVGNGSCDIVVIKDILPYLLSNFETAGRVKLSLSSIALNEIKVPDQEFKLVKDTVASMRLDSIVSSGFSISRETAASAIREGRVSLQYQVCTKTDKSVNQGDVISIRGLGKIELAEIGNISKKGRTFILIRKYI